MHEHRISLTYFAFIFVLLLYIPVGYKSLTTLSISIFYFNLKFQDYYIFSFKQINIIYFSLIYSRVSFHHILQSGAGYLGTYIHIIMFAALLEDDFKEQSRSYLFYI